MFLFKRILVTSFYAYGLYHLANFGKELVIEYRDTRNNQ